MKHETDELNERVTQYRTNSLPGQPIGAHMGTSYLIGDLMAAVIERDAEIARLREALKNMVWLIDEGQLVEAEPSHVGPLLVDKARAALAATEQEQ